ncbi:MAG: 4-alpha-glucanotransferase [Clostridiales bacterium]|nr:4-alpha-glucanotransferase [Clostridiales bacterium]
MLERSCGVLMPIFSLPSKYGIGTLGKAAKKFVDFLVDAGHSYWQILPVGPTSYGDSPYQSFSTFAGNPYFIDLEELISDKLLTRKECESPDWGDDPHRVDYAKIYNNRFDVLRKAYQRGKERDKAEVDAFARENVGWLPDYALYMAVKRHFGMKAWFDWEDKDIRLRKPEAVKKYFLLLAEDIDFFIYVQYLFFKQWDEFKKYANEKGISIIGDIPIYVAMDSADVWSEPQWFQLDDDNVPKEVAGVPPDYFSADGQLWGNPLYRWDRMAADGYGWWIRRIGGAQKLYDVLRIDHFRGMESYWAVPYGAKTARNGRWVKGPGMKLVGMLTNWFSDMQFIAEDLGILTPEVRELLADSGLPGMKVLEFAFDHTKPSNYLPHVYNKNCICYAGTHDNATLKEWYQTSDPKDIAFAKEYLGLNENEGFIEGVLRGGMSSVADLFIAQMQDWLELGAEARINTPGTSCGNWQWRMDVGAISKALSKNMARMAVIYGRSDKPWTIK